MKFTRFFFPLVLLFSCIAFFACEEDTTTIGSGIAAGEVEITIDTFYFTNSAYAKALAIDNFDSRTGNLLLGNIEVDGYGKLNCSFVTRFMCAPNLQIADSLLLPERVDSCKLVLGLERTSISGDSLSPQILSVFLLNKQLPSDITNTFNPEGYYNPSSPLGSSKYTVSNVSSTDSMFYNGTYVPVIVNLDKSFGEEIFEKYQTEPEIFQWPQTLAEKFLPGMFVKSTFGKGVVANIYDAYIAVFYHSKELSTTVNDGDTITELVNVAHAALPFSVAPEVISSNNISYIPSRKIEEVNAVNDGLCVITTPGGYFARLDLPMQPIIDRYREKDVHLSTVNDLYFYLPAEPVECDYDISVAENLLLIKTSEYESFFKENKIPDNLTSFTGVYDSTRKRYLFSSLRDYFIDLLKKDTITADDLDFMLVPVEITTETNSNSYYGTSTSYVTKCVPYSSRPTMTLIDTTNAMITFSFSTQLLD